MLDGFCGFVFEHIRSFEVVKTASGSKLSKSLKHRINHVNRATMARFHLFWSIPRHWGPIASLLWLLVPSTYSYVNFSIQLNCNVNKLYVVTDFCIRFVNKIHIIGKGMIKETWTAKIKEIRCWAEELITFCLISPVSTCSKNLPNFAVTKRLELRLWAWRTTCRSTSSCK